MRYFQSMDNSLFTKGFLNFIDFLRNVVANEYSFSYADMLDLFNQLHSKDISIEFALNRPGVNQTYIRTLYYALALDESLSPGFAPNTYKFDPVFGNFEGDYMSRENYNISDFFYSMGAGGLPYAFATKKTEDARQLGHMLYRFTWGFEHQLEAMDDQSWSEKLEKVLALGTRLGTLDDVDNLDELNHQGVELPVSLRACLSMDFHQSSPTFKQELISTVLGEISRLDDSFYEPGQRRNHVDVKSLACNWSIELGRCLLIIDKPVDVVIEKVTELFDAVLACDQALISYHDVLLNHVLRSCFFHYPKLYRSVFPAIPENGNFVEYTYDDKSEQNIKLMFSDEYLPIRELTRPQNLLNDNEMVFRAALGHEMGASVENLPYHYHMKDIYTFSRFNIDYEGDVFTQCLVNMLDRFNVKHICKGYDSGLHAMASDVVRVNEPVIYEAYNRMLIRADSLSFQFDGQNEYIRLLF